MIYLDYNATAPVDDRVLQEMLPFFSERYGNASAVHLPGIRAYKAVEQARSKIAASLHADEQEIIFTSGATESINFAIKGLLAAYGKDKNHIITVSTEHSAVINTCESLKCMGTKVDYLSVDKNGLIDLEQLKQLIKSNTLLISVMYANNETGVLQSIKEIGNIAKENNVFFFCDAAQAAGKVPLNVQSLQVDMLAFSGHKMYGPKGIGGLYIRRKDPRVSLEAQMVGGGQERGLRSGTLNVPGIVGMSKAMSLLNEEENSKVRNLRDRLENALLEMDGIQVNGSEANRMFNVSNMSFAGIPGKMFMNALNKELALSSGSACGAKSNQPSHVLTAMGLSEEFIKNAIRFSLGRFTTDTDIDKTIEVVKNAYLDLKE